MTPTELGNIRESAAVYEPDGSVRGEPALGAVTQALASTYQEAPKEPVITSSRTTFTELANKQTTPLQDPAFVRRPHTVVPEEGFSWGEVLASIRK